jgi:hypothetical protein
MPFSSNNGGQTGIRTLDTLRYTRFPSVRLQPLGHLSAQVARQLSETNTAKGNRVSTPSYAKERANAEIRYVR